MFPEQERPYAVVRLTEPGKLGREAATVAEWQGVIPAKAESEFNSEEPLRMRAITAWPTSYLAGMTWYVHLENSRYTGPGTEPVLHDLAGLELWTPIEAEGEPTFLDPLAPNFHHRTDTGSWVRIRYYRCYNRYYALGVHRSDLEVWVSPTGGRVGHIEIMTNGQPYSA